MLIPTAPGLWRSQDNRYEVTHRPGAHDDYKIVALVDPKRWSIAATLDEADFERNRSYSSEQAARADFTAHQGQVRACLTGRAGLASDLIKEAHRA